MKFLSGKKDKTDNAVARLEPIPIDMVKVGQVEISIQDLTNQAITMGVVVQRFMEDISEIRGKLEKAVNEQERTRRAREMLVVQESRRADQRAMYNEMLRRTFHAILRLHPPCQVIGCGTCAIITDIQKLVPAEQLMSSNSLRNEKTSLPLDGWNQLGSDTAAEITDLIAEDRGERLKEQRADARNRT